MEESIDGGISKYTVIEDGEEINVRVWENNGSLLVVIPKHIALQYSLKKKDMLKLKIIGILRDIKKKKN